MGALQRHYRMPAAAALLAAMLANPPARAEIEDGLVTFARTLGAVHYLRGLCRPGESQTWRNRMLTLLSKGNFETAEREKLVAAFNAGYSKQQAVHRACTEEAADLGNAIAAQGAQQARLLAAKYR